MHPKRLPLWLCLIIPQLAFAQTSGLTLSASISNPTCPGFADGKIQLTATGGQPPYHFIWQNGLESDTLLAPAGNFQVTATDASGHSVERQFQLADPAPLALADVHETKVSCIGMVDGSLEITVAGGSPPYQFHWWNGLTTSNLSNVAAGNYALTVTDAHACKLAETLTVGQPEALFLGAVTAGDTCERSSGEIKLTVLGGTPPHDILWDFGEKTLTINHLAAGEYAVTVTDAHACSVSITPEVEKFGSVPTFITLFGVLTCLEPKCGIGVLNPAPGVTYFWEKPDGTTALGPMLLAEITGNYHVLATDPFGCTATTEIPVIADTAKPKIQLAAHKIVVPCGKNSALLDGSASPQNSNLKARWLCPEANFDTVAWLAEAHLPGKYIFKVWRKYTGCVTRDTVEVEFAPPISEAEIDAQNVRCFGFADGQIRVGEIAGGTPPYFYSFENQDFAASPSRAGLSVGEFSLEILDSENCRWRTSVLLTEPDSFFVNLEISDSVVEAGRPLHLRAKPFPENSPAQIVAWLPAQIFGQKPDSREQTIFPKNDLAVQVEMADANGCRASASCEIRVPQRGVFFPNAFAPGSDANGFFTVFGGTDVAVVRSLRVFDRWGGLVFERQNFPANLPSSETSWDGRVGGQAAAAGVYIFAAEVEFSDGLRRQFSGEVTLLR